MKITSDFAIKGDGTPEDAAWDQAINACAASGDALYVPAAPNQYRITRPLNLTNTNGFRLYGDGAAPTVNRWTPTCCSVIAGACGTGHPIIDATGANGLVIRDLTLASIGLPSPATLGIIMGTSAIAMQHGGNSNLLDNVTIFMPQTGTSCGLYCVNVNLLSLRKVNIMSDICWMITDANDLGITPMMPFGASIQSDGCDSSGCNFEGYGTQIPVAFAHASCHDHSQLYIVNLNGGKAYTGVAHALMLEDCDDFDLKGEFDYFPAAVCMAGFSRDVRLRGTVYRDQTPIQPSQPAIASLIGTGLDGCEFMIRNGVASPANALYETNGTPSTTNTQFRNTKFLFDTQLNPTTCAFDLQPGQAKPYYNLEFIGDEDFSNAGINLSVGGRIVSASQYRIFVQGIRAGSA